MRQGRKDAWKTESKRYVIWDEWRETGVNEGLSDDEGAEKSMNDRSLMELYIYWMHMNCNHRRALCCCTGLQMHVWLILLPSSYLSNAFELYSPQASVLLHGRTDACMTDPSYIFIFIECIWTVFTAGLFASARAHRCMYDWSFFHLHIYRMHMNFIPLSSHFFCTGAYMHLLLILLPSSYFFYLF